MFKKAYKFLIDRFKDTNDVAYRRKSHVEDLFFDHYFRAAAESLGLTMEQFLFTSKKRNSTEHATKTTNYFNPKTINTAYIKNVTESDLFVVHLTEYLDTDFIGHYCQTVAPKMRKIIKDCEIAENGPGGTLLGSYRIVLKNDKCKLPWTRAELEQAAEKTKICILKAKKRTV